MLLKILVILSYLAIISSVDPALEDEEIMAVSYIQYLSERQSARHKRDSEGEWAYASNITEYNLKNKVIDKDPRESKMGIISF